MALHEDIERVAAWLEENVVPKVELKVPPELSGADTEGYDYELAHPTVHRMYWPSSKDMCPEGASGPHPGILVQVSGGSEVAGVRSIDVALTLSAWSPGTHGRDIWYPKSDGGFVCREDDTFRADPDVWRDTWNFLDVVMREVGHARSIGGLAIDRARGVSFGPYKDETGIIDLYPYCFATVTFTVVERVPTCTDLDGFL